MKNEVFEHLSVPRQVLTQAISVFYLIETPGFYADLETMFAFSG